MHLIQLLFPVTSHPESQNILRHVRDTLAERFGGVTAYSRAPAHGIWHDEDDQKVHDDVVIIEVMTRELDRDWWAAFRRELEQELDQDEIVIRASSTELL